MSLRCCRLVALAVLLGIAVSSAAGPPYSGRPLTEVLEDLSTQGLGLIWSDAVVGRELVVEREPRASDPRALLDEILAPHGLRARPAAAGGVLVVERAPPVEIAPPPAAMPSTVRPSAVFLEEVVVTPSHFRLMEDDLDGRRFLSRAEVERMPHAGDDLYRAVRRLPGTSSGDFSATFNVRGGTTEEMLVLLDGVELYEPFHLKNFQSAFSIIDSSATGGVDLLTGGYPARYGDTMSGVMEISVANPEGRSDSLVALGTLNARIASTGSFHRGLGSWLVSARAWYPDDTIDLVGGSTGGYTTDYFDLLARVEHRLGLRSLLAAGVLAAFDDLGLKASDPDESERLAARYGTGHLWLNLRTVWSGSLDSRFVVAAGRLRSWRDGEIADVVEGVTTVDDNRSFAFVDLRQDWTAGLAPHNLLTWGFELSWQEADYAYLRRQTPPLGRHGFTDGVDEVAVHAEPEGWSYGLYVADRFQPASPLVVELGLRWDDQSWTDGRQLSPRVNLRFATGPGTVLRVAWGSFRQAQTLNQLPVEDGVAAFYPSQRSEHWLLGVDHVFGNGLDLRVEGYYKDLSELWPRYENQFSPNELFPESRPDRILVVPERGRAAGLELWLKHELRPELTWWLGATLATVEDAVDGDWQPRSWDQRGALTVGLNLGLPRGWSLNVVGVLHGGWPTTEVTGRLVPDGEGGFDVEPVLGRRNGARHPSYHRLDLRAGRSFALGTGSLTLMIEVLNLLDTDNVCCVDDFEFEVADDGTITTRPQVQYWAPIVPSVNLAYRF